MLITVMNLENHKKKRSLLSTKLVGLLFFPFTPRRELRNHLFAHSEAVSPNLDQIGLRDERSELEIEEQCYQVLGFENGFQNVRIDRDIDATSDQFLQDRR